MTEERCKQDARHNMVDHISPCSDSAVLILTVRLVDCARSDASGSKAIKVATCNNGSKMSCIGMKRHGCKVDRVHV